MTHPVYVRNITYVSNVTVQTVKLGNVPTEVLLFSFIGSFGAGTLEDRQEWQQRAEKFKQIVLDIQTLFVKICACQNRELVYDLYTYLWDMCGVVQTLDGFIQWMSKGSCSPKMQNYVLGQQTWFSGLREAFTSGGLVSDLQRLLPLDSGNDLYQYKFPEVPAPLLYYVRPFEPKDEKAVYQLVGNAYETSIGVAMGLCCADCNLVGDKYIGAYLNICPEYTFVCENSLNGSIVGYACGAPDAKTFFNKHNMAWLPEMKIKYPQKDGNKLQVSADDDMLSPIEKMAMSFHKSEAELQLPESFKDPSSSLECSSQQLWGCLHMHISDEVNEPSLAKRLTMLLLASLRASGCLRAFVDLSKCINYQKQRDFYSGLGFLPLITTAGVGDINGEIEESKDLPSVMTRCF